MQFDILTLFPEFFTGIFEHGVIHRAITTGRVQVRFHDLRTFTHDRHRTVDDRPFGGGEGMVLKPEPLAEGLASLGIQPKSTRPSDSNSCVILLSAQGRTFNQSIARELARTGASPAAATPTAVKQTRAEQIDAEPAVCKPPLSRQIVFICGRYEGVDERINQLYCDLELSIGDYVLSGGELAAAVIADAVIRLLPGVLGNDASSEFESFGRDDSDITLNEQGVPRSQHGAGGLLDYPHYTRPAEFQGLAAPPVLLNGDHHEIRRWRREQQLLKTFTNRPDLLERASLNKEDHQILKRIRESKAADSAQP